MAAIQLPKMLISRKLSNFSILYRGILESLSSHCRGYIESNQQSLARNERDSVTLKKRLFDNEFLQKRQFCKVELTKCTFIYKKYNKSCII